MGKEILVSKEGEEFVAKVSYHLRDLVNKNGAKLKWNPKDKTWRTKEIYKIAKLLPYIKEQGEAIKEIKNYATQIENNLLLSESKDSDFEPPTPTGKALFPFQRAGVEFLVNNPRALLGDEMGTGKTVMVIATCNHLNIQKILVICPVSIKLNWRNEIKNWSTLDLPIHIIDSKSEFPDGPGWYIINYDITHKFHEELRREEWPLLVCDEAHYLKNVRKGTKRAREVLGEKKWNRKKQKFDVIHPSIPSSRAVFASGTPIENRPIDIFYLLNYLDPIKWSSYWKYAQEFCDAKPNRMGYWEVKGATNLSKLNFILRSTVMIRRLKRDVLKELPPKTRQVVELSVNTKIKKIIEAEKNVKQLQEEKIEDLKAKIILAKASEDKEEYQNAVNSLKGMNTYIFEEIAEMRAKLAEYKIPDAIAHIKDLVESGIKVVVFGHHHVLMAAIQKHFGDICVSHNGKMGKAAKQDSVDRFQKDDTIRIFNGSIMASGVGITLTEGEVALFTEFDWRPSSIVQAEDRLCRIGQKKNVLVQYLVYEDSIDVELAKTVVEKQEIIDEALDSDVSIDAQLFITEPSTTDQPISETEPVNPTKKMISEISKSITSDQIAAIGEAISVVAGLCDGAHRQDQMGFNMIDSRVGKSLSEAHTLKGLTPKQAALGKAIIKKYKKQIPKRIYDEIFS